MVAVRPHAIQPLWPIMTYGIPGMLAPITSVAGEIRCISYHIAGMAIERCGSFARRGLFVTDFSLPTTQALLAPCAIGLPISEEGFSKFAAKRILPFLK